MNTRKQLVVLVLVLLSLGTGLVIYKHKVLGFPLLSSETQSVWVIEARIAFEADGGPARVKMNLPDPNPDIRVTFAKNIAPGYHFENVTHDGTRYAQWQSDNASGPQSIYMRASLYFSGKPEIDALEPPVLKTPEYEGARKKAAEQWLTTHAVNNLPFDSQVIRVLNSVNERTDESILVLLQDGKKRSADLALLVDLLALQNIPARLVRGVLLTDMKRRQSAVSLVEVHDGESWHIYDPREESKLGSDQVLLFQRGEEPMMEIFGGSESKLTFSTLREQRPKFRTAVAAADFESHPLIDFSIYSLPLSEQNAFKLLLLIPLGALVVVILRNLVGIRTSGTFMPILIALTFLQTSLAEGLVLFVIVVGVGLILRSYLSQLDLLLVPRIASVLVFVIIIYAAIGIASHKLDLEWGMKVTFFPMIILAWTIERMSILWDEEGMHEVLIQVGGSLLTATLAYLLMNIDLVGDTLFLYPEFLLIVLAIIISIGSYSGYRLSDLYRFEPMERL